MTLKDAQERIEYIVEALETGDEEVDAFLFSLGCYAGEPITVISHINGGCIVSIKDGRYTIDNNLANAILI
ncbi:MAG: ferrous iron transport protein A [Phascolarctobacterium sp.]|nr:ferrous iron transport protein A [Phascolarctobacterium sp.]